MTVKDNLQLGLNGAVPPAVPPAPASGLLFGPAPLGKPNPLAAPRTVAPRQWTFNKVRGAVQAALSRFLDRNIGGGST